ncbi:MAG TPA: hypothetical protein VFF63_06555 [Candidatus Babeliales bacterium]|nr:hypothetical protein [Candidatus Babeliales bacterium]
MANRQLAKSAGSAYLYVADTCEPAIDVLQSKTYYEVGSITNGMSNPGGVFADAKGNLYVFNIGSGGLGSGNVTEYAPNDWSEPIFTYNADIYDPTAVTVDAHGNVYAGVYGNPSGSSINEYYQQQNVAASCSTGSQNATGLAVDGQNDVFAALSNSNGSAFELVEYVGGLNGCGQTALPLPSADMNGGNIALDKNGNLLIPNGASVEVVDAPGYSTVNTTIGTGFGCANNVTLNKANTLAFVTDICNDTVTVVNYPGGANAAVLETGNGIFDPVAAVEHPNAVY